MGSMELKTSRSLMLILSLSVVVTASCSHCLLLSLSLIASCCPCPSLCLLLSLPLVPLGVTVSLACCLLFGMTRLSTPVDWIWLDSILVCNRATKPYLATYRIPPVMTMYKTSPSYTLRLCTSSKPLSSVFSLLTLSFFSRSLSLAAHIHCLSLCSLKPVCEADDACERVVHTWTLPTVLTPNGECSAGPLGLRHFWVARKMHTIHVVLVFKGIGSNPNSALWRAFSVQHLPQWLSRRCLKCAPSGDFFDHLIHRKALDEMDAQFYVGITTALTGYACWLTRRLVQVLCYLHCSISIIETYCTAIWNLKTWFLRRMDIFSWYAALCQCTLSNLWSDQVDFGFVKQLRGSELTFTICGNISDQVELNRLMIVGSCRHARLYGTRDCLGARPWEGCGLLELGGALIRNADWSNPVLGSKFKHLRYNSKSEHHRF